MKNREIKILIIEDSEIFIERLRCILAEIKYKMKLFTAGNYEDAIYLIKNELPTIVLLDIRLPGKSGIDVLRTINQAGIDVITVVISNLASKPYREACFNFGVRYFIDKSNDFERVSPLINSILEHHV